MHNQTSKIARRARTVPVERGELWGSIYDSLTSRITEIDAVKRIAYGDAIAATNRQAQLYNPEFIQCSGICGQKKHYLEFDRTSGNDWRFHRDHRCKQCRKLARLQTAMDDSYLRSKPNNRRKKSKLPESPARTA